MSGWGEKVTQKERIEQLLKESIDGTITAEEVTKAGKSMRDTSGAGKL